MLLAFALVAAMALPAMADGNETTLITVADENTVNLSTVSGEIPAEVCFPIEGSIFFDNGSYQVSWTENTSMYETPLTSVGIIPISDNISILDAEWITVREETAIEQSYRWDVSPNVTSGEYILVVILDYSEMSVTHHQEMIYSNSFFVINDGIDSIA